jgi:hypothetical protein
MIERTRVCRIKNDLAWCPKCHDAMDSLDLEYPEYIYHCFGCDEYFHITPFSKKKAEILQNKQIVKHDMLDNKQ